MSSLAVWVMRNSLVPQRRIQVRYVTVTKMRGYSCTAEVPVVSVSAVVEEFPSRFHLPYPDRDHTSQSLLAERLSASTLEPIAQQLISLIIDIMVNRYGQLRRFTVCVDGAGKHSIRQRNVLIGLI